MGTLMQRAWHSVREAASCPCPGRAHNAGSDCLTPDILMSILCHLSAKELATASMVCRGWRSVAKQDLLWERLLQVSPPMMWKDVLFAETYLRFGPGEIRPCTKNQKLPFCEIYKQRVSAPVSVILDGGSGYCKYGLSCSAVPGGLFPTFLEFGNIETPLAPRLRDLFLTIFECTNTKPASQPIVISEPLCNQDDTPEATASRKQLREVTHSVLFGLGVPAVCSVNQALLALFSARLTSGLVVNFGFHVTTITPILHGQVMRKIGIQTVGQGAMRLTGHLGDLMQQAGIAFGSMYTAREVKEKLCYVAQDYEEEAEKCTEASCTVIEEGVFTLREERYKTPEILFQPLLGGLRAMGLHLAVALSMDRCAEYKVDDPADEGWYKTLVLAGGTASLAGLPERLDTELRRCLDSKMSDGLNVIHPVRGSDAAWFGANMMCNVSTFQQLWCVTKQQFTSSGHSVAHALANEEPEEVPEVQEQAYFGNQE